MSVERNGDIVELTDKDEIERAWHSLNTSTFSQTNDTSSMKGRLVKKLGFLGNSVACDQKLNGAYSPPVEVDQHAGNLLQALAKPSDLIDTPRPIISTSTF